MSISNKNMVRYGDRTGEIIESIPNSNYAIVKFENGEKLLLPIEPLNKKEENCNCKPKQNNPLNITSSMIINQKFIDNLVNVLYKAGVYDFIIKDGKLQDITIYETLELKKERLRKEALKIADKQAEEEFEREFEELKVGKNSQKENVS